MGKMVCNRLIHNCAGPFVFAVEFGVRKLKPYHQRVEPGFEQVVSHAEQLRWHLHTGEGAYLFKLVLFNFQQRFNHLHQHKLQRLRCIGIVVKCADNIGFGFGMEK